MLQRYAFILKANIFLPFFQIVPKLQYEFSMPKIKKYNRHYDKSGIMIAKGDDG